MTVGELRDKLAIFEDGDLAFMVTDNEGGTIKRVVGVHPNPDAKNQTSIAILANF